ncbi:MAG: 50S ribosomal protein L25 [Parcubacteria group bacterium Licking1014_1]|nr:MAG: 50S ribosomal protein L25 [Parcubacteria group bacterium Licking1014_1]
MISLSAKIRKVFGKKTKLLKKTGKIPAIVYGPGVKNVLLEVNEQDFQKVFEKTGENSLVELEIEGEKEKRPVLIHEIQKNPVTDRFIHVDFFQASLKEEVEVKVPLALEGISLAVKDLGGTLVKNISELEIKSLPQNLPREIKVFIDKLDTFEDHILVKDLDLPKDVKVLNRADEIVVSVAPPSKIEEELEKPIEEKVEEVEKVEKKEKKEEIIEEEKK